MEVVTLLAPPGTTDREARRSLLAMLGRQPIDGVFLEFPFPIGIDESALCAMIPEREDIDIMTEGRIATFFAYPDALPPITVAAGLALLDRHDVAVTDRSGLVIGPDIPFTRMFREAFARRGARMRPVLVPDDRDLHHHLRSAGVVVAAASRPGVLRSTDLAPGTVALDVGYFNPGGRGDIDLSGGVGHLTAVVPVPGGGSVR